MRMSKADGEIIIEFSCWDSPWYSIYDFFGMFVQFKRFGKYLTIELRQHLYIFKARGRRWYIGVCRRKSGCLARTWRM